jgi:hypothetical protein
VVRKVAKLTTIAVSRRTKARLDSISGRGQSYNEVIEKLLQDSLSEEVKRELDELRGPSESYDNVVRRVLQAGRVEPDELRVSRFLARLARRRIEFEDDRVRIKDWGGE